MTDGFASEAEVAIGSESVSPAIAGGSTMTKRYSFDFTFRRLTHPLPAGGTDSDPSSIPDS